MQLIFIRNSKGAVPRFMSLWGNALMLSKIFNWKTAGWMAWGAAMFLIGGVVDFTLFHEHPLGQAMISAVKDPLLNIFDMAANTLGLSELARNAAFLGKTGVACALGIDDLGVPVPCN